jgi:transcription initiation factor IIE alpha subunit
MNPNTFHTYRPLVKFHKDRHFIYITTRRDKNKEELQSYYKLNDEDMEEITKEWPIELLVSVEDAELSDPDIIGSPLVTRVEHDG